MRILLVVVALTVSVALPRASWAQDPNRAQLVERVAEPSLASTLPKLLRTLGVEI